MFEELLDIETVRTVVPSYSWDEGIPDVTFNDFLSLKEDLSAPSNNSSKMEYVGWAPYTRVEIVSDLTNEEKTNPPLILERRIDFGDYYNSKSNVQTVYGVNTESFCHTYVMPGLYTIKLYKTTNILVDPLLIGGDPTTDNWGWDEENDGDGDGEDDGGDGLPDADQDGKYCYGVHCVEWQWIARDCTSPFFTSDSEYIRWIDADCGHPYEKKWFFQPCVDLLRTNDPGTYIQSLDFSRKSEFPFANQWDNFLCDSTSIKNDPITWGKSEFQGDKQITWGSISGPCLNLRIADVVWKWDFIKKESIFANNSTITWDETKETKYMKKTWDEANTSSGYGTRCEERTPSLSAGTIIVEKEYIIRVKELLPEAYIEVCQPEDPLERLSPLTVRLSPKFTKAGSFPIEKIVWDFGDGSPLLEQKRWALNFEPPFVYSNSIKNDYKDPRNFDVIHTYTKNPSSGFVFYPSLTAYAMNTYSSDCASATVGPIIPQLFNNEDNTGLRLMQNEVTDESLLLLGEVENTSALWVVKNNRKKPIPVNLIKIKATYRPGSVIVRYTATATYKLDQNIVVNFKHIVKTATAGTIYPNISILIQKNQFIGTQLFVDEFLDYLSLIPECSYYEPNVKVLQNKKSIYTFDTNFECDFELKTIQCDVTHEFIDRCDVTYEILKLCDIEYTIRELNTLGGSTLASSEFVLLQENGDYILR